MTHKAVFLDRDGTIIKEAEYLADPAGVEVLPGSARAIRQLHEAGFKVIVTSNQSGVARGFFDEATVKRVNAHMETLLQAQGAFLDAIYYCPHYAKGQVTAYARECECRKPGPGMLLQAVREQDVDLAQSWVIGDKPADVAFGLKNGVKAILVLTGYGQAAREAGFKPNEAPEYIAADLEDAARFILAKA